jgi:hypothetical protein
MVRSRRFIQICLIGGMLCALSCTKEIGNVETEYFYGDRGSDSAVLGRIGVLEGDVEKSWESPRKDPSTETSFRIFIRERHSTLRVSHYLRGNGYFCLRLPPGEYTLWRWIYTFPRGQANTVEPLPIYFDVLPGKVIYIGTLCIYLPSPIHRPSLSVGRANPRYEIVEEYVLAMAFSRNRYPGFPRSVERHLMYFSR